MSNFGTLIRGPMGADVIGHHFSQTHHGVYRDKRLHAKSKGVFALLTTHKNGYGITPESLAACMADGVGVIKTALRELEKYGYLYRIQQRTERGTLGGTLYFFTDIPEMTDLREWVRDHWSPPKGKNHPLVLTRENAESEPSVGSSHESPALESGKTDTTSSGPVDENPPADDPPAENAAPKNNNHKNTNLEGDGGEEARTRAGESNPYREPSVFARATIRSIIDSCPQTTTGVNGELPEFIGEGEFVRLALALDDEIERLREQTGRSSAPGDLAMWLGRGLHKVDSVYGMLRHRLRPGYGVAAIVRPRPPQAAPEPRREPDPPQAPEPPEDPFGDTPVCDRHDDATPRECPSCEAERRAAHLAKVKAIAAETRRKLTGG